MYNSLNGREKMDDPRQDDEDDVKMRDLIIAQNLNLRRPGKKEQRFSKTDGRYIPPPEIKKEVEKLKAAKEEAERRKNRIFGVIPLKSSKKNAEKNEKPDSVPTEEPPPPEKKKKLVRKISKKRISELRGTDKYDKTEKTVSLLNSESERRDAYSPFSAAVPQTPPVFSEKEIDVPPFPIGLIFDDARGFLTDCVFVVRRVRCLFSGVFIKGAQIGGEEEEIALSSVVGAYDLKTMKPFDDLWGFLTRGISAAEPMPDGDLPLILASVRYDLLALAFVSGRAFDDGSVERKIWTDYISERCGLIDFDETQILDYIRTLSPDEQGFFDAIDVVVRQPRRVVESFVRAFVRLVLADGVVRPAERRALAEVLLAAREQGFAPKMFGLR